MSDIPASIPQEADDDSDLEAAPTRTDGYSGLAVDEVTLPHFSWSTPNLNLPAEWYTLPSTRRSLQNTFPILPHNCRCPITGLAACPAAYARHPRSMPFHNSSLYRATWRQLLGYRQQPQFFFRQTTYCQSQGGLRQAHARRPCLRPGRRDVYQCPLLKVTVLADTSPSHI